MGPEAEMRARRGGGTCGMEAAKVVWHSRWAGPIIASLEEAFCALIRSPGSQRWAASSASGETHLAGQAEPSCVTASGADDNDGEREEGRPRDGGPTRTRRRRARTPARA